MMFRLCVVALAIVIVLAALPGPAYACPMCKDAVEADPRLAAGYNWSILGLVGLPFLLVAAIAAQTMRVLNPAAYQELKRRAWGLLWPHGWLYLSSAAAGLGLLVHVTAPVQAATRLRLPSATLAALPPISAAAPMPPLEDRVAVVTFFASWCPPCVEQVVDLARLRHEFDDHRLAVVAVNAFEDYATPSGVPHLHADGTLEFHAGAPDLASFIEANQLALPVVVSTPDLLAAFAGVTRIPTTFVFDAEGRLVRRYTNEARGAFVRPGLDDLRRDVRGALACGGLAFRLVREACTFWVR